MEMQLFSATAVTTPLTCGNSGKGHKRKRAVDNSGSKRKPNFLPEENKALALAVQKHHGVLFDKFSSSLTMERKNRIWSDITNAVNSVGGHNRSIKDIMKKYGNLKSDSKKMAASNRRSLGKTGGGSPEATPMSQAHEIIASTIPAAAIDGVSGGVDLYDDIESNPSITFSENELEGIDFMQKHDDLTEKNDNNSILDVAIASGPKTTEMESAPTLSGRLNFAKGIYLKGLKKLPQQEPAAKKSTNELMATQVSLMERQVVVFEKMLLLMERRNEIEEKKLALKQSQCLPRVPPNSE